MNVRKMASSIAVAMMVAAIVTVMNVGATDAGGMHAMSENVRLMNTDTPEPTSIIVRYTDASAPVFEVVEAGEGKSIEELVGEYNAADNVSYAEPNYIVHVHTVPD
ncbi:MAG: hypothetical protein J7J03_02095, partial [Methanosarcinales archaeon]|nr:hypothetical protein [Methanosarcinales archaeon]